ncbi:XdhC family aldehyde oxidoreductase maturation factor [Desulfohalovibrio reitneri]|uniref:XdhC family aldehyde oxidoreductase maturation factor n=1 Tax=Desulfohalovibrio reitneri TaxID=1307759 RepID=UPI0004A6CFB2|nr:XdhC/CoxI family protein [Desulfohalovibrio reitneri]
MRQLLEFIRDELRGGRPVAGAVIISSSGSTPRSTGSRMAVASNDATRGTVGGGPAEAMAQREAARAHETRRSSLLRLDLTGKQAAEAGMICGGEQEILIEYLEPSAESLELVENLLRAWEAGRGVLCTAFLHDGGDVRVLTRTTDPGNLPSELPEPLRREARELSDAAHFPFTRTAGGATMLVEPVRPPGTVVIAGAGHVGQATAHLCAFTGMPAVVLDDRGDFLTRERLPQADRLHKVDSFENCFHGLEITPDSRIVILTRGHVHDKTVLAQALRTPAGYIGMIGSTRKRDATYESLLQEGFTQADLGRVHCPIGLSIGADTPEEIAVSIVAELINHRAHA